MELTLVSAAHDEMVKVLAAGRMTSAEFEKGRRDPIETAVGHNVHSKRLLIDMHKVTYIDSAAIGWLITCNKNFKEKGGKMVLHSLTPNVSKVFKLLRMNTVLAMADSEPEAEAMAAGAGAGDQHE